jgi:2-oxo-4-hydroxy-4-carboxy--5-ureidoimidazoline (OHCU) decarboxylase
MHDLPRQLTVDALAELFEGRTRLVARLAKRDDPLGDAPAILAEAPEDELIEALNAHPRIGAGPMSARSAREQGNEDDPAILTELARLNRAYEDRFGFRFVVFVNGRTRSAILHVLEQRLGRPRPEELQTGVHELLAIARARYRARGGPLGEEADPA